MLDGLGMDLPLSEYMEKEMECQGRIKFRDLILLYYNEGRGDLPNIARSG